MSTAARTPVAVADLTTRRAALIARSAQLRDELRGEIGAFRHDLRHVDRGVAFARSGLLMPLAIGLGVALLVGRPSRVLRVAGRVLALWPLLRPWLPRAVALVLTVRRRFAGTG